MMFNQSFVRVRAGTRTDRGGNTVPDWGAGADHLVVDRVNIQPNTQDERVDAERNAVITGYRVQSAEGTAPDVLATDRIEWDGQTFEVDGDVARWPEPFTDAVHHIEFAMKRATG